MMLGFRILEYHNACRVTSQQNTGNVSPLSAMEKRARGGRTVSHGNQVALESFQVRGLSDPSLARAKSSLSTCVSRVIPKGALVSVAGQASEGWEQADLTSYSSLP